MTWGFRLGIAWLLGMALLPSARADDAMANQALQQALYELKAAKAYVREAKAHAQPTGRRVFHYAWLLADIDKLEKGIRQKWQQQHVAPRHPNPLKGDYWTLSQTKEDS